MKINELIKIDDISKKELAIFNKINWKVIEP
jgi:hypothetical protein